MPRTSIPGSADAADAGFVLIEIIPALVILGLVLLVAFPGLPRGTGAPGMLALAVEAAAILRDARTGAIASSRETVALVDARARTLSVGGRGLSVPGDVDMSVLAGGSCRADGSRVAIVFRPDGTSCGSVLRFAKGTRGFRVRVNWATGNVAIVEGV